MQRCVQVEWEDGLLAKFSYIWLRDNTRRRPSLVHLDLNARPEAIKCSKEALEVQWPPFLASKYTSNFLRENALYHPIDKTHPSPSGLSQLVNNVLSKRFDPLNGSLISIVDSRLRIDEKRVLGTCYWEDAAQEPGTIWPHLTKVPSLCTVDTLNGLAEISVVDTSRALKELCERHPNEFDFLANSVLEYNEGPFRSTHPICKMDEPSGHILPGVFNNAARSSAITVESLDRLYESLQKFGRCCARYTQFLHIFPGQRLLFNNKMGMLGVPAQSGRLLMVKCFS